MDTQHYNKGSVGYLTAQIQADRKGSILSGRLHFPFFFFIIFLIYNLNNCCMIYYRIRYRLRFSLYN